MGTITQILHLESEPFEWVLRHLGHTEDVHCEYYRLQSDVIEKTKVAKLLCLAEEGHIADFYGKKLEDIDGKGKYVYKVYSTDVEVSFKHQGKPIWNFVK